jgi:hypothetical protein
MDYIKLLSNYSDELHLKSLYTKFDKLDFKIIPIKNINWGDEIWLLNNKLPYVSLTHLLDSYYCLPDRPDMAFTYIWKAINNNYVKLGKTDKINKIIHNNANGITLTPKLNKALNNLSDSEGIEYLKTYIFNRRNDIIINAVTIKSLLKEYISFIPIKTLKFISNIILKGIVIENGKFPTLTNNSTYYTIKTKYPNLLSSITDTYGISYKRICIPIMNGVKVNLQITDTEKSRNIIHSLSNKLKELLINQTVSISNSNSTQTLVVNLSDSELIDFMLRIILYSIRNNSVHGNLVERLNSDYANKDSLKASIYIYYVAHYFFSLSLYANSEIALSDLTINIDNFYQLSNILNS